MDMNIALNQLNNLLNEAKTLPSIKGKAALIHKLKRSIHHLKIYKNNSYTHLFLKECTAELESILLLLQDNENKKYDNK